MLSVEFVLNMWGFVIKFMLCRVLRNSLYFHVTVLSILTSIIQGEPSGIVNITCSRDLLFFTRMSEVKSERQNGISTELHDKSFLFDYLPSTS